MYANNKDRIIIKHDNFLVYLAAEKYMPEVLKEIEHSGRYNGEKVFIAAYDSPSELVAIKNDNQWKVEKGRRPLFSI